MCRRTEIDNSTTPQDGHCEQWIMRGKNCEPLESNRNEMKWNGRKKSKYWQYSETNCLKIKSSNYAHFTIFDEDVHTWMLLSVQLRDDEENQTNPCNTCARTHTHPIHTEKKNAEAQLVILVWALSIFCLCATFTKAIDNLCALFFFRLLFEFNFELNFFVVVLLFACHSFALNALFSQTN